MSDGDPFDAFAENKAGSKMDGMSKLEYQKGADAKLMAEDLLNQLELESRKRSHEPTDVDEDVVAAKRGVGAEEGEGDVEGDVEGDLDLSSIRAVDSMPRIQIHKVDTNELCVHEVAIPPDQEYRPLVFPSTPPCYTFEYVLDPFQKQAILCIDNNQSVLVSAHTSAGKTTMATYAIAQCLRDKQRVIYTTPIKALSNQKYRDMNKLFGDVGLMTGDVTINPSASCLVMTTEILRSMLYRGSEIMREVGWVVFDEIHYMRDPERGVVWEETIILLPDNVHYVFLSATIPNARQFAEWVCYLHDQPCHVVYTEYRPVPLRHYVYPCGGEGMHLAVDENGVFKEDNFEKAMNLLQEGGDSGKRKRASTGDSHVLKVVRTIMEKDLAPAIVFSFSRKDCEAYAQAMTNLDFNDEFEQNKVQEIFENAIAVLSDEDKQLPQVGNVLPFLRRGIGIHHSGLLPILKEVIEIMFAHHFIKVLFATETFSMGLNMPARTVVFTSARKFDGVDYRWLTSGEYIQMSGRAGRRGTDTKGLVILMLDQKMTTDVSKQILKGAPDSLDSRFKLTYNMVLNLLRVEGINPEFMLERSFFQFQNYAALPKLEGNVERLTEKVKSFVIDREHEVMSYYKIKQQIAERGRVLQKIITKPIHLIPQIKPGRLVHIKTEVDDFGWGIVLNFQKKMDKSDPTTTSPMFILDVLLYLSKESVKSCKSMAEVKPCKPGQEGTFDVIPMNIDLVYRISSIRLKFPQDLTKAEARLGVYKTLQEVKKRFPDGLPLLDPIEDLKIKDPQLKELVPKIQALEDRLASHPIRTDPNFPTLSNLYEERLQAESELKSAKIDLKKAQSLLQMEELKKRKRVLRRLGYADANDVISLKGRVACEISAADELLLTEMLFSGTFNPLAQSQCAALLSCLVFQENAKEAPPIDDSLTGCLRGMQEIAKRIAKVTAECKLEIDEEKYVEQLRPHLMQLTKLWCNGSSFAEIAKMTDIFEGSIIRAFRRLEELLREMVGASKAIGNAELEAKFTESIRGIKRDIVFAASLYL